MSVPALSAISMGNGDGTFQGTNGKQLIYPPQSIVDPQPASDAAPAIIVADFNGDGSPDVATANTAEHRLYIALNDGTGTFTQSAPDFGAALQPNTSVLLTADLNGDGLPDVIGSSYTTGTIQIFLSKLIKSTPTVTLTSSAAQSTPGTPITLTVKVAAAGAVPTGTVSIADGATPLGQITLDSTGQGTLSISTLSAGQHSLFATYSGDTKFNPTTSTTLAQSTVDFTVTLTTPSQTVAPGSSATYTLAFASIAGLTGNVAISCTGLPVGYACAAGSATLGAQPTTATLTVSPTAHASLVASPRPFHGNLPLAAALLPAGALLLSRRRRAFAVLICAVAAASLCFGITGCSSSSNQAPVYRGTSTFTILATTTVGSQTLSHQSSATLTVQ